MKAPARRGKVRVMPKADQHKPRAASSAVKQKSAMDTLLDTMRSIIDEGARKMTPKELEESEKKFNAAIDRAVAARKRRRETA